LCCGNRRNTWDFVGGGRVETTTALFGVKTRQSKKKKKDRKRKSDRAPSKVVDYDGPTPEFEQVAVEDLDPSKVDELRDIASASELVGGPDDGPPLSHQPWRRGDTAGCDDPIAAEWRAEAETVIKDAATLVGANVLDVTWYLTQVVVTVDETRLPPLDMLKDSGPVVNIETKRDPQYEDPNDPNPEDLWENAGDDEGGDGKGEILYTRETPEQAEAAKVRKNMMYATKDPDKDPDDEPHIPDSDPEGGGEDKIPLFANEETRSDVALKVAEDELERQEEMEQPIDVETSLQIDTAALSTVAQAILDALEDREDELQVLSRHELILTSPGASDVLETQKQFAAYRGFDVIVETQDPFNSNRTLKGKLVDRNAMDLIINKKGRMVTVPLNFVKCVRLPPAKREKGVPRDAPF